MFNRMFKFLCFFMQLPVKVVTEHSVLTKLAHYKGLSSRIVRRCLNLAEFNVETEHKAGKDNAVADTLSLNPQEYVKVVEDARVRPLSSLVLLSRVQLMQDQKDDEEFGRCIGI